MPDFDATLPPSPPSSASPRAGLTAEYLRSKRDSILAELRSQAHFEATDTVIYGDHDPFDVPPASCETCGAIPQLSRRDGEPVRWLVACGCGRAPRDPRPWPWLAMLAWNQMNLMTQDYRALPLFWLDDLDPAQARTRMVGIRHDLELRLNLAGLDRRLARLENRRPPGQTYPRRLDAYLQWALLALRLIKVALPSVEPFLPPRSVR